MDQDEGENRGVLGGGLADKIKAVANEPALQQGLMDQAAAMGAAGSDPNVAGSSPATGSGPLTPGAGAAAAGS